MFNVLPVLSPAPASAPRRFPAGLLTATLRVCAVAALLGSVCACSRTQLEKIHTEHLGVLTGTVFNRSQAMGLSGTDLGVSFFEPANPQRIVFLFGDSWTFDKQRWDQDSAAWTLTSPTPDSNKPPRLNWLGGEQFSPIRIPNVDLGGMNVPVEGLVANGRIYVFASTGWDDGPKRHCCSVLAHTEGLAPEFDSMILDHAVPTGRFVNISAFVEGQTVWLFGNGHYRESDVFLARTAVSDVAVRERWQYYRGTKDGNPVFGPGEAHAQPIVGAGCVGELSVRPHPQLGYLMLYNCDGQGSERRGVLLHRADTPWGPWDPPINIFNPDADRGYGYFIHQKFAEAGFDDGLAEPGAHHDLGQDVKKCPGFGFREECWGGEYGPYLVPQWFSASADGGYSIVYTLSSWVPYQVHLMRTVLAKRSGPKPAPPARRGGGLPATRLINGDFGAGGTCNLQGWASLGDTFGTFRASDGGCRVTTYTLAKGDGARGSLFQDFTVDARTRSLRFLVHGGEGTVRLHRGPEIVRETRGRSGHEPRNVPETRVCWNVGDYAGETLRLAIVDGRDGAWGFVGVTGFTFYERPCARKYPELVDDVSTAGKIGARMALQRDK